MRKRRTPMNRVEQLAETLLASLERAAGELDLTAVTCREKTKTDTGEHFREYQQLIPGSAVDRGGLKQLTAVLKDIRDILSTDADNREQEARIAKLQRDLGREEAQEVRVWLEGEAERYAD